MKRRTTVGLVLCSLLLVSAARALAQSTPWRIVQASDGTPYLLKDGVRYAIVGEPIDDDELGAYADGGGTGATLLLNAIPARAAQAPAAAAPIAAAPEAAVEAPPAEAVAPPQAAEPAAPPAACTNTPAGAKGLAACNSPSPSGPTQPAVTAPRFVSVTGNSPGRMATVSVQASPGETCGLAFAPIAASRGAGQSIGQQTVGPSGTVTWSFVIDANAHPGTGSVTVTCGRQTINSPIQIGEQIYR